jgi:hypothetical protein
MNPVLVHHAGWNMAKVLDCIGDERPLLTTLLLLRSPIARWDVPFQPHIVADINPCSDLFAYCLVRTSCNGTSSPLSGLAGRLE